LSPPAGGRCWDLVGFFLQDFQNFAIDSPVVRAYSVTVVTNKEARERHQVARMRHQGGMPLDPDDTQNPGSRDAAGVFLFQ
jgi:hypothetical protein